MLLPLPWGPLRRALGQTVAEGAAVLPRALTAAEAGRDELQWFCWEMPHQKVLELIDSQAASGVAYGSFSPPPPSRSSLNQTWEHISVSLHSFREVFVGFRSLPGTWIFFLYHFDLVQSKGGVAAHTRWEQSITQLLWEGDKPNSHHFWGPNISFSGRVLS